MALQSLRLGANMKTPQIYKQGKQTGYDAASRRYRDASGRIISKRAYRTLVTDGDNPSPESFGFTVPNVVTSPYSGVLDKLEAVVAGASNGADLWKNPTLRQAADRFNALIAASAPAPANAQTQPIPTDVKASMNLVDYYTKTNGDVWQHIEAPIDVAVNPLEINCPDDGVKRELEELYDSLSMWSVLYQNWMACSMYGIALPLEVWEGKDPVQIVHLPPRYVWIGYYVPYGIQLQDTSGVYSIKPLDNSPQWTNALAKSMFMPMTYNSFGSDWNEQIGKGWDIPINPNFLHPVRNKAFDYQRYPIAPLSRAFRALGSRSVFDEVVRATIEGYKNQLWVFLLGDLEHVPSSHEMLALKETVTGMAGERTGALVWRGGLTVEQHTPKPLEQMLSMDARQAFTMEIFRHLGASGRLVTGNSMSNQRSDGGNEIDLSIWLKRLDFPRTVNLQWEKDFRRRIGERRSETWRKANDKTTVQFSKSLLEVSDIIEKELRPLYAMGLLSRTTTLEKSGYNYDAERNNKQNEQKDLELFTVVPTYSQTTVNKGTPEKKADIGPQGRPPKSMSANEILAAWENDEERIGLMAQTESLVNAELGSENSDGKKFIAALLALLLSLDSVTERVYRESGGMSALSDDTKTFARRFVSSFAVGFEQAIAEHQGTDKAEAFMSRALLYPQEGYKMAAMNGQAAAMAERGARYWKRVTQQDKNVCEICAADALVSHSIEEPFQVMHPNERCAQQFLHVQYMTAGGLPSIEIPVPRSYDYPDEFTEITGAKKRIVRRKRNG